MDLLAHVILAALAGFGIAIILVEKKTQWPATSIRPLLEKFLGSIHSKLPEMLNCSTCTSFWAALLADLYLTLYSQFQYVPCWPISGFIAAAITWTVIELMNAIDPK
jgi:hypothetical protein